MTGGLAVRRFSGGRHYLIAAHYRRYKSAASGSRTAINPKMFLETKDIDFARIVSKRDGISFSASFQYRANSPCFQSLF